MLANDIFLQSDCLERNFIEPPNDENTYYDGGVTSNIFHTIASFIDSSIHTSYSRVVKIAEKSTVTAKGLGDILVSFQN